MPALHAPYLSNLDDNIDLMTFGRQGRNVYGKGFVFAVQVLEAVAPLLARTPQRHDRTAFRWALFVGKGLNLERFRMGEEWLGVFSS